MTIVMSVCVCIAGLICVVFNKPLARSNLKYHPKEKHAKMFVVGRIAYVLAGCWMMIISLWIIFRTI